MPTSTMHANASWRKGWMRFFQPSSSCVSTSLTPREGRASDEGMNAKRFRRGRFDRATEAVYGPNMEWVVDTVTDSRYPAYRGFGNYRDEAILSALWRALRPHASLHLLRFGDDSSGEQPGEQRQRID